MRKRAWEKGTILHKVIQTYAILLVKLLRLEITFLCIYMVCQKVLILRHRLGHYTHRDKLAANIVNFLSRKVVSFTNFFDFFIFKNFISKFLWMISYLLCWGFCIEWLLSLRLVVREKGRLGRLSLLEGYLSSCEILIVYAWKLCLIRVICCHRRI